MEMENVFVESANVTMMPMAFFFLEISARLPQEVIDCLGLYQCVILWLPAF